MGAAAGGHDESGLINLELRSVFAPLLRAFLAWSAAHPDPSQADRTVCVIRGYPEYPRAIGTVELIDRAPGDLPVVTSFLECLDSGGEHSPLFPFTQIVTATPVGAYGVGWAEALARAANALRAQWVRFHRPDPFQAWLGAHPVRAALIKEATFNGDNSVAWDMADPAGFMYSAIDMTVREGLSSAAHAIAQLTMHRVTGYDDPGQLARESVAERLPDRLGLMLPLNVLGPMTFHGLAFPQPVLAPRPGGGIDFSPSFQTFLLHQRELYRTVVARRTPQDRMHLGRAGGGHGCPVGSRDPMGASVIQEVSQALMAGIGPGVPLVRPSVGQRCLE